MIAGISRICNQRRAARRWAVLLQSSLLAAGVTILSGSRSPTAISSAEDRTMASNPAIAIVNVIDPVLRERGFSSQGFRWYRYEHESILVLEVQPARYSPGPYINLGVYYYRYGRARTPKIVECQVDTRLTSLLPNPLRGDELLDASNQIPDDVRRAELEDIVRSFAVPWLEKMALFAEARAVLASNPTVAHIAPIARPDLLRPR
jgi:hypothetical protein